MADLLILLVRSPAEPNPYDIRTPLETGKSGVANGPQAGPPEYDILETDGHFPFNGKNDLRLQRLPARRDVPERPIRPLQRDRRFPCHNSQ